MPETAPVVVEPTVIVAPPLVLSADASMAKPTPDETKDVN